MSKKCEDGIWLFKGTDGYARLRFVKDGYESPVMGEGELQAPSALESLPWTPIRRIADLEGRPVVEASVIEAMKYEDGIWIGRYGNGEGDFGVLYLVKEQSFARRLSDGTYGGVSCTFLPLHRVADLEGRPVVDEAVIEAIVSEWRKILSPVAIGIAERILKQHLSPSREQGKTGWELIIEERQRQQSVEGWTHSHDDRHDRGELEDAARCYLCCATEPGFTLKVLEGKSYPRWPWDWTWFKPFKASHRGSFPVVDRFRCLVKAGALALAEEARLDRCHGSARERNRVHDLAIFIAGEIDKDLARQKQ